MMFFALNMKIHKYDVLHIQTKLLKLREITKLIKEIKCKENRVSDNNKAFATFQLSKEEQVIDTLAIPSVYHTSMLHFQTSFSILIFFVFSNFYFKVIT